jgi:hypothetical protein
MSILWIWLGIILDVNIGLDNARNPGASDLVLFASRLPAPLPY